MKRIKTIAVVLGMALLCFTATAMAGEASFYDTANDWIVRAYTVQQPTNGMYSVFIEMLDSEGNDIALSEILVNGQTPAVYPLSITNDEVIDTISIAYKYVSSGTELFLFGTHVAGQLAQLHNNTIIARNTPVAPANISVSGSGSFGNVNVGSSSTNSITVSNTGEADLTLTAINVTGTSFSRNGGTCGTTVEGGDSCTIGVKFEPAAATSYSGTLSIQSNDGDQPSVNVGLTGTGIVQTGTSDLIVTSVSHPSSISSGGTLRITVTVKNQGTASAGPSKVRTMKGSTWLLDIDTPSIAAGQSVQVTNTVQLTCPTHASYYLYHNADGYGAVTESNETNNMRYSSITCNR